MLFLSFSRKVGIYKDTANPDLVWLHVYTKEGVLKFGFSVADFTNGWFSERPATHPKRLRRNGSPYQREEGAAQAIQAKLGRPLHPAFMEALTMYAITPTSLKRVGKRRGKAIQWLRKRYEGRNGQRTYRKPKATR